MAYARKKLRDAVKNDAELGIPERMRLAIASLGYKRVIDFINDNDIKQSTLYAVLNRQTKDPGASILKIFYYAGINLNWLVSGEGEILRRSAQKSASAQEIAQEGESATYAISEEIGHLEGRIQDAMENIKGVYQQVTRLKGYAEEIDQLPHEKQALFHKMVRALLQSMREEAHAEKHRGEQSGEH